MPRVRQGRFLGLPYDWRRLTAKRARAGVWNQDDPRAVVPKGYGWGLGVNFAAVWRRLTRRSR